MTKLLQLLFLGLFEKKFSQSVTKREKFINFKATVTTCGRELLQSVTGIRK